MSKPRPASLVSLTGGRGHMIWEGSFGSYGVYKVCDRDKDAALVKAYTENVGHAPNNVLLSDSAWDQWNYNPRRPMYRGRALELAA